MDKGIKPLKHHHQTQPSRMARNRMTHYNSLLSFLLDFTHHQYI